MPTACAPRAPTAPRRARATASAGPTPAATTTAATATGPRPPIARAAIAAIALTPATAPIARCAMKTARAGGFTPQAYVYGLDLSREETRARQRENLATAIARLESLSAVQAARDAANRRDDAAGAATTTAVSNAATQAQLSRLSRIVP